MLHSRTSSSNGPLVPISSSLAEVKNAFSTLLDHIPALIAVKFENILQKITKNKSFCIFI